MDIKEIRRKNLDGLVRGLGDGNQRKLGELIGKDPSLISQILQGSRNMGEKLARDIEQSLNMKNGALDELDEKKPGIRQLHRTVSKRAFSVIERLKILAQRGDLSDADLDLIERLLAKLTKPSK